MPYAVAAAAIAAGGAAYSADQAKSASNQQVAGSNRAIDTQALQADLARRDSAPYAAAGKNSITQLQQLLGLARAPGSSTRYDQQTPLTREQFDSQAYLDAYSDVARNARYNTDPYLHYITEGQGTGTYRAAFKNNEGTAPDPAASPLLRKFSQSDLEADPVYQSGLKFGADQGRDAINARATQSGQLDSGATLKALTRFGTDYGSTKANESYNRFTNDQNNIFNRLSGISGTGQVATSQVNASGANAANNISQSLEGAGNARAAGIVGGANAWGNAGASTNNAMNNYQNNQLLQKLLAQNQGGSQQTPYFQYSGYDSGGGSAYG